MLRFGIVFFGDLDNEFFIGFDKLYMILASEQHELLVILEDYIEDNRYQLFDNFTISSEATNYSLQSVGSSYGDAGDLLYYHLVMQFSTKDRKNDLGGFANCAQYFMGAWWYRHCHTRYGSDNCIHPNRN
ncbi:ficolin-1-A-like [Drosophila subpulchrella]|uniref:ficolin-1-A-like n=1 Tax=Drosophila subpulchrella TaxID=1486046 RepID=UPI0018A149F4|nr:ficolin-1-A-like [Drosophila subpulchrella]